MGTTAAFQTQGKTVTITTQVAAQATLIRLSDLGLTQAPQSLRLVNNGTADVWVWIDKAIQGGVNFPTPGTTTAGTPQYGVRLKPGIIEVYGFNQIAANPNNDTPAQPGFYVNTIGTVAGSLDVSPGEGM